ncbi:helix-turn-helix domain-containing protein [Edaphobacter albus]|uniref:helix-turn-helix domain-containing protein n=1 Tax=Edaphobacter sp. 4G125 TaxID=2763071 RepID=UPI00164488BC|nr:AraC family transcriptional regulator [Edaphobacter sp. 4G125]QNI36605.1 helix-turn-helix transcriptional regulator [Edaphobacter sp. 4G125]
MDKKASPNAGVNQQVSEDSPFTTFFQLNERSVVPSEYRTAPTFSITRLTSPFGLQDRITKSSSVPALLLSVSLKPLASSSYRVWAGDKLIKTSTVHSFRSNVVDFDSQPRCWAGSAFDFMHYSIPRTGLNDIAEDLGYGQVRDYRPAVLEDDLVVAQITKSILPYIGRNDAPSVLALDQLRLVLGAHLLQRYGILLKTTRRLKGGLAPWQKRRASEVLHANLNGHIRLAEIARECGLSTSHFARSFKTSFGVSAHQWLIQHRIDVAKQLMSQTGMSLTEISIRSGFNDQAAFTNAFRQLVGVTPGRWRRELAASRQA